METFIWILSQLNTKTVLPGTRFYSKSSFHFIPIRHYPIVWSFVLVDFGEFSPKVFRKALIYLSAKLNPYKMKEKSPFLFFSENVISHPFISLFQSNHLFVCPSFCRAPYLGNCTSCDIIFGTHVQNDIFRHFFDFCKILIYWAKSKDKYLTQQGKRFFVYLKLSSESLHKRWLAIMLFVRNPTWCKRLFTYFLWAN